jgi:hypothetical protein
MVRVWVSVANKIYLLRVILLFIPSTTPPRFIEKAGESVCSVPAFPASSQYPLAMDPRFLLYFLVIFQVICAMFYQIP